VATPCTLNIKKSCKSKRCDSNFKNPIFWLLPEIHDFYQPWAHWLFCALSDAVWIFLLLNSWIYGLVCCIYSIFTSALVCESQITQLGHYYNSTNEYNSYSQNFTILRYMDAIFCKTLSEMKKFYIWSSSIRDMCVWTFDHHWMM